MSDAEHSSGAGEGGLAPLTNFDLDAAWLRHAEADHAAFFSRFVAIVSQALPHHATIEKVSSGFFRKKEEVVGIAVVFDNETYVMRMRDGHRFTTQVEKKVRGVVLSTRDTDVPVWIAGLMTHIRERTDKARAIAELLAAL